MLARELVQYTPSPTPYPVYWPSVLVLYIDPTLGKSRLMGPVEEVKYRLFRTNSIKSEFLVIFGPEKTCLPKLLAK